MARRLLLAVLVAAALVGCGGPPLRTTPATPSPTGAAATLPGATAGTSSAGPSAGPSAGRGTDPAGAGSWELLPAAPVSGADERTGVWTGDELLLYVTVDDGNGGRRSSLLGYRPAAHSWRTLATPPQRPTVEGAPRAVWTGREMLLWGGGVRAGYTPATNRWRTLPPLRATPGATVGAGGFVQVWTGLEMLLWGGGCCDGAESGGAAYRPDTDSWRPLAASPLSARSAEGVWTGSELLIAGGNAGSDRILADAAAYSPGTDRWRRLPPLPSPRTMARALWTGSELLLLGGRSSWESGDLPHGGLAFSPTTGHWRQLPDAAEGRQEHVAVWTGTRALVWGGWDVAAGVRATARRGEALTPSGGGGAGAWTRLPLAPLRGGRSPLVAVWTGSSLLVWGGGTPGAATPAERADGAGYTPSG